jgi:GNAT superfamily N-acetyltransferase
MVGVSPAVRAEGARIVDVLVDAFRADPMLRWMFPDDAQYEAAAPEWFALSVAFAQPLGHCYLAADGAAAVVWMPPDAPRGRAEDVLEAVGILERHTGARSSEIMRGLALLGAQRPAQPPSFMLRFVGVRPGLQGRGAGAAALAPVLARCDAERVHAALDATSERVVPFYERLGFVVLAEVALPNGGPVVRPMWREPR